MRAPAYTPRERERKIAALRKITRDPNTSGLMRLMALREISKLMGLRPRS